MAKRKATITVDGAVLDDARRLLDGANASETIGIALSRFVRAERLRRDLIAYAKTPVTDDDLGVLDLEVSFDLGDDGIDYEALYGNDS